MLRCANTGSNIETKRDKPINRQAQRSMLRLSTNLKGTEHNEEPDSPRSPQAPTAATLHSVQPAQSPGYHSNSD